MLFKWDWLQYLHNGTLQQKPTHVVFSHPFYTQIPDHSFFIQTYLNLMQSRSISTQQSQQIMVEAKEKTIHTTLQTVV